MTEYRSDPKPPQGYLPSLEGVIERVCGDIYSVYPEFSLVQPSEDGPEERIYEFFSSKLESQVIMFDAGSNIERKHYAVSGLGIQVFEPIFVEGKALLLVPEGTKSVDKIAHLFSRNPEIHQKFFGELGRILGELYESDLGTPNRSILKSFALAPDAHESQGASVYLLPPYNLGAHDSLDTLASRLTQEYEEKGLSSQQIATIMEKTFRA